MTETKPTLAVVVLNWNGWQDTQACVRSLLDQGRSGAQIVVCDNGSADGSFDRLRQIFQGWPELSGQRLLVLDRAQAESGQRFHDARVVLIQTGANLGFAGGCNVGLRFAMSQGAAYFWLLNNDTEIEVGADEALLARMRQDPAVGLCGSRLIYHHDRSLVQARGGAVYHPRLGVGTHIGVHEPVEAPEDVAQIEASMDYVVGASMVASRRFIETVGLMTEDYFLYFEELDWATRGKANGFRLAYAPGSVVFHKEGATIGSCHSGNGSALSMRFLFRNRLLFTKRFYPALIWAVRRNLMYETLVYLKRRQFPIAWLTIEALLGHQMALPPR